MEVLEPQGKDVKKEGQGSGCTAWSMMLTD